MDELNKCDKLVTLNKKYECYLLKKKTFLKNESCHGSDGLSWVRSTCKKNGQTIGQFVWGPSSKIVNGRVHTNKIVSKFFKYHVF